METQQQGRRTMISLVYVYNCVVSVFRLSSRLSELRVLQQRKKEVDDDRNDDVTFRYIFNECFDKYASVQGVHCAVLDKQSLFGNSDYASVFLSNVY